MSSRIFCWWNRVLFFSKELMNRPVSLLCGHSGCQECIHQLISNQSGGGREKVCAVCREPINEHMLNISIPLSSVISKLNVKCTNVGCTWVGEHGSKERHQETCSFLLLECPNGCPGSHLRDSLERHLEICPQEKVPCKYCTAEVERYILDQHEPTCQEKPGPCPLNCGHNLPRSVIIQLSPWIDSQNFVIILLKKRAWKKN